jgi:hypothetical protein
MVDYFENDHWMASLQSKATLATRLKMVHTWFASADPTSSDSIFDVGASPEVERPDANCMLRWFLERTTNITLYSPDDIAHLVELFPGVEVRSPREDLAKWPAKDSEFDYVTSSAVLEHVGNAERQMDFLREAGRVARKGLFITTPNRWHALEFHTKILFIHWLPKPVHRRFLRWVGRPVWAEEANLNLLTKSQLMDYAQRALGDRFNLSVKTVRFAGMVSNLLLIAERKADSNIT